MTTVFKLFTNVIPVRGAKRSTLCDLQRGRIKLIPNDLHDILTQYQDQPLAEIQSHYDAVDQIIIEDYFRFLIEDEWGFYCEEPSRFPALDLTYEVPHHITNAILDVDSQSNHDFPTLAKNLEAVGCRGIQIRVFDSISTNDVEAVLVAFQDSKLRNLDLWIPAASDLDEPTLLALMRHHPRVYRIVLHGAEEAFVKACSPSQTMGLLVAIKEPLYSERQCGYVDRSYFTSELYTFAEAVHWNSCLNRKISIDKQGQLRQCPAMQQTFGAAESTPWLEVIQSPEFQEVWSVTKDHIDVCQDCEFRYVCTDCRAFTQDNQPLGKPAKCHYDPYTAQWQEQTVPAFMPV